MRLKLLFISLLFIIICGSAYAQNSLNSGDFTGAPSNTWGAGQAMGVSAGTSLILTKTVATAGDKFFRFFGDGSPCGEYQPNASGDFFTHSTVVTNPNGNCGSGNAWRINVPTTTSNVVFKTDGNNTGISQSVAFVVQGAVQTVSTVTQLPTSANVQPGQAVTVTAGLSGSLSTGQGVYLRYSNDNFTTSTVVQLTGSGSTYTGTIPATLNLSAAVIRYYVFTSTDAGVGAGATQVRANGSNADFYTINLNNNGSSYNYTVAIGVAIYLHNFNDIAATPTTTAKPYTTSPTATTGSSAGVFNTNLSSSSWNTNLTNFTSFAGFSSTASLSLGATTSVGSDNLTLTFNVASGFQLSASSFNFWRQRSATGPANWSMTINGTSVGSGTTPTIGAAVGVTNVTNPIANLTGTVTVVMTLTGGTGGTLRLDEFTINGTVSSIPTSPPSVTSFAVAAPGSGSSGYVGNTVTVTGTGFTGVSEVRVGGSGGTVVSSFTVVNDTTITFPAINASGTIYVLNGSGNSTSAASYSNLGYITQSGATNWNTSASWLGGAVPPATAVTTVAHGLTISAATPNSPSTITVNSGITLNVNNAAGAITASTSITNNGTVTFSNTGNITTPLFTNANILSWSAAGTLNISASGTLTNNGTFSRGTGNVNFLGAGTVNGTNAITFNNLTMTTGALSLVTGPTIDGTFTINGGNINNANNSPVYTANSTLVYNATYARFAEWSAVGVGTIGTTAGYPNNVTVSAGTFTVVNGDAGTTRAMNGNLLISTGTTFTTGGLNANFTIGGNLTTSGAVNMSNTNSRLTVNGNITIASTGSLALSSASGGDLYVNGNLTNNATFTPNARAVFFSGTSLQTITGSFNTTGATNNLPFVFINNSNNVALAASVLINNNLTLTLGKLVLGTFNTTLASGATISLPTDTNYVQTSSTGKLIQNVGAGNVFYPVGKSTYNPITLNNSGGTADNYGIYVLDAVATPATNDATKMVNRFWNINESEAGGNDLTITTQWNTPSEENANFAAGTIARIGFYVSAWTTQTATAGTGTLGAGSATFASNTDFTPTDITTGATIGAGKDDAFTFPPPTVSSFTPTSAYTGGTVVITGTNFSSATGVTIGGVAASFTVNNATQITATVAAGASGSVVVTSGTGSGSLAGFTYLGYISNADGSWSTTGTWLGNSVPPNDSVITINHAVNLVGSNPTQTSITVNAGRSLTINGAGDLIVTNSITNSGTVAFSSTGTITTPIFTNNGTLSWTGGTSTLNISTGGTLTNAGFFTSGTGTVNFIGGGTISGTIIFNNLTVNGAMTIGSNTTVNGNLTLNASSSISSGVPTYGISSTLIYNSGGTYNRGNEWTGASSGAGFPNNVRISTTGTTFNINAGTAFCRGNIVVDLSTTFNTAAVALNIGGSLAANGTFILGGDVYISGLNWTIGASGTQTNNSRAVFFNAASGNQTITRTGGGNVFFDYLVINKAAGNVVIEAATNIEINTTVGNVLQIINAGQLDLNGRSLALNNNGGNILVTGGERNIIGGANSSLFINGPKTVSGSGTLVLGANVTTFLTNSIDFGVSKTTINGTLTINNGGSVNTNPPTYSNGSTLIYNSGTTYGRNTEWSTTTGFGYPNNVTINVGTTLDVVNSANSYKRLAGNLTILGTITINGLTTGLGGVGIEALGNIINDGTISFGSTTSQHLKGVNFINGNSNTTAITTLALSTIGGDLEVTGNFTDNAIFTSNGRAVWFTGTGIQLISGNATAPFNIDYIVLNKPSGVVRLGVNCLVGAPLTGNAIVFSSTTDIIELNGNLLTIGTNGVACVITGDGFFRGTTASQLVINGTGAFGTLRFDQTTLGTTNTLSNFTLNRTVSGGVILGNSLQVNGTLTLTDGTIALGSNNLTIGGSGSISVLSPSATKMIIADGTGELRKIFTGNVSFVFPIGDNTVPAEYSPVTLNFTAGSYAASAYVGLKVTDGKHLSNVAPTDFLTRFWSVTSSGITSPNYSFTGTYISGTADVSGIESNSKPGRWDGTDWIDESVTSISGTVSLTDLTTLPAINQFTAGAPLSDAAFYYRSNVNNGLWNTAANWQSSADGSTNWVTATTPPSNRALGILIRNGFNINSNANRTADDITIEAGATLTISAGTFILNNGTAATDLQVNGTVTYSGGTFTQNASSSTVFDAASTYNHSIVSSTLTLPIATRTSWNATSNCNVTGMTNSGPITGTNMGHAFGNFNWNNASQGSFVNIENSAFRVNGTLTVGPTTNSDNKLSFGNNAGTFTNVVNTIVVSGGQLNGVGNTAIVNLTVTNSISISGGIMAVSDGSGKATITVGTNVNLSGTGELIVINKNTSQDQILTITDDLNISGTGYLDMEMVSSTGTAIINVGRDFICTATFNPTIDFGTGSVAGNVINIARNFNKSGTGQFQTFSSSQATGFSFNGNGVTQTLNYSGANSNFTSYIIQNNAKLQLNTDLTLGTSTGPISRFTVVGGGTLDFQTFSIVGNSNAQFITNSGSNLITSNSNGIGGTTANGSVQSFSSVLDTTAAGRATFAAGTNYTFNGNTTTPFPVPYTIGNPATINVNATITSNVASASIIVADIVAGSGAVNVNNGGTFILNATSNNLFLNNNSALNIASGGTFDNNGENLITFSSGTPSVNVTGRFITRDEQGFVGPNTAIPSIVPTLNVGSTVEYGKSGDQAVQGSIIPEYKNVTLSVSGTKTLQSAIPVSGLITTSGTAIFDAGTHTFGGSGTDLTMLGTSEYKTAGTGTKPDAEGNYTLGIGTKVTFTSGSISTPITTLQSIRISSPVVNYYNVDIVGNNVGTTATGTTGVNLKMQANGTFTVKNTGTFKHSNTAGFSDVANAAISNTNSPIIKLEVGSTIEYAGANQTITALPFTNPFSTAQTTTYSNLKISGTGDKKLPSTEVLVNNDLEVVTGTYLKIESDKLLTVANKITAPTNPLDEFIVIYNNGSLVQINDGITDEGNISLERSSNIVINTDYTYWSSPVSPQSLYDLSPDTLNGMLYSFDSTINPDGDWKQELSSKNMDAGIGYIVRGPEPTGLPVGPAPYLATFVGKPNNGIYPISSVVADKSYLLGNPYPSALDADTFLNVNAGVLDGTLYFWTHNTEIQDRNNIITIDPVTGLTTAGSGAFAYTTDDYASYNVTGGVGIAPNITASAPNGTTLGNNNNRPSGKIASGQGFFATSNITIMGPNEIIFNNSMRVRTIAKNNLFFRIANTTKSATIEKHRIWLNLTNTQGAFKQTLVGYITDATNEYDSRFDGESFDAHEFVDFYSVNQEKNLVIQGRALPFNENDEVPLGFRTTIAGPFTINIDQVDGALTNQSVFIEDKLTNTVFDLKTANYTFNTVAGTFNDRFILRYTNKTLSNKDFKTLENQVLVSNKNKQIKVNATTETIDKVTIYDLLGRQLFKKDKVDSNELTIPNLVSSQQTLLVKVSLQNGQTVTKKIIY